MMEFEVDPEQTIKNAFDRLLERGWVKKGQTLVVITNALAHGRVIDTLQLRYVD